MDVAPEEELETVSDELEGQTTFRAIADAQALASQPDRNYGAIDSLRSDGSPQAESYLQFQVAGLSGSIQSAKLRLWVTNASSDGPAVRSTAAGWSETALTWRTRPALGTVRGDKGAVAAGAWIEYDVTPAIPGNGTYGLALVSTSGDGTTLSSREGAHPPELVVTTSGCAGVAVAAGSNVQSAIDGHPEGTTFCLAGGTFHLSTPLRPKARDRFIGAGATTILDGGGSTPVSFSPDVGNVTVASLVVQHFADRGLRLFTGWVADRIEARFNDVGVSLVGDDALIQRSKLHDNGSPHSDSPTQSFGLTSNGVSNGQVLDNEIYGNNPHCNHTGQSGGGAGASKFWASNGFVLEGNYWHDNFGNGIWLDGSDADFVIRNERIENNTNLCNGNRSDVGGAQGIRIEVSCRATIQDSVLVGNAEGGVWFDNSFGNTLERSTITMPASASIAMRSLDADRDKPFGGSYLANCGGGAFRASNNRFTANVVTYSTATQWVGTQAAAGQDVSNNTFAANVYHASSCGDRHWSWSGARKTFSEWRALGQDTTGTCGP